MRSHKVIPTIGGIILSMACLAGPLSAQVIKESVTSPTRDVLKDSLKPVIVEKDIDIGAKISEAGATVSDQQRLAFANSIANRSLTGIGETTHLELDKGALSIPRKINGRIYGMVRFGDGQGGVALRSTPNGYQGTLELELLAPSQSTPRYYLTEIRYTNARGSALLTYMLNGELRDERISLTNDQGLISILTDVYAQGDQLAGRVKVRAANVTIKSVSVSPAG